MKRDYTITKEFIKRLKKKLELAESKGQTLKFVIDGDNLGIATIKKIDNDDYKDTRPF